MKEIVSVLLSSIVGWINVVFELVEGIFQLPTTPYGLVKFIAENNIIFFNSAVLTKFFFHIIPLIVSHAVGYLLNPLGKVNWKVKEAISILLYVVLINIFSSARFWIIIGLIVIAIATIVITYRVKVKGNN